MSYNGAGVFSINSSGQPVVTGTVISSTVFNAFTADIATGLSTAICKDGQTTITGNIPLGANRITGLGAGTALTDAIQYQQVQNGAITYLTAVAGTNTVTATAPATMAAYATGQEFTFLPAVTNTGATTLNINSIGAKNVFAFGAACIGGELKASVPVRVQYDGTQFNVLNPVAAQGTFTATLTGCTTSPTYTVKYIKYGAMVVLQFQSTLFAGTSNATTKTLTGMPSSLYPAARLRMVGSSSDNGGSIVVSTHFIETTGVITLCPTIAGGATGWTNSGAMEGYLSPVSYTLN